MRVCQGLWVCGRGPDTSLPLDLGSQVLRFEARMVPLGPGRPLVGPHDAERRCG